MAGKNSRKKKEIPGIIIECKSGRYLAYYEHRTDIIANGENEKDAKKNLKKMYKTVIDHEKSEEEKDPLPLPENFNARKFVAKF